MKKLKTVIDEYEKKIEELKSQITDCKKGIKSLMYENPFEDVPIDLLKSSADFAFRKNLEIEILEEVFDDLKQIKS